MAPPAQKTDDSADNVKNVDHVEVVTVSPLSVDTYDQRTIWQLLIANPKVIGYSIIANAGSLLFGYDLIVNGAVTALPAFQCVLSVSPG